MSSLLGSITLAAAILSSATVIVTNPEGIRIPGVAVELVTGEKVSHEAISDSKGVATFFDVSEGVYLLKASSSCYEPSEMEVTVAGGSDPIATIQIRPVPGPCTITIECAAIEAGPGASLLEHFGPPPNPSLQRTAGLRPSAAELMIR